MLLYVQKLINANDIAETVKYKSYYKDIMT